MLSLDPTLPKSGKHLLVRPSMIKYFLLTLYLLKLFLELCNSYLTNWHITTHCSLCSTLYSLYSLRSTLSVCVANQNSLSLFQHTHTDLCLLIIGWSCFSTVTCPAVPLSTANSFGFWSTWEFPSLCLYK